MHLTACFYHVIVKCIQNERKIAIILMQFNRSLYAIKLLIAKEVPNKIRVISNNNDNTAVSLRKQ